MAKKVTDKQVQVHESCKCGHNEVYPDLLPVRYRDFKIASIKKKKAGLFLSMNLETCACCRGEEF